MAKPTAEQYRSALDAENLRRGLALRDLTDVDSDPRSRRGALIQAMKLRDKSLDKATELVGNGGVSEWSNYRTAISNADTYQRHIEQLRVSVLHEPKTYGDGSPNSYWLDLARRAVGGLEGYEAEKRLDRHSVELRVDDPKRAAAVTREVYRSENRETAKIEEQRAGSSSTLSFTVPQYDTANWASYNDPADAFRQAVQPILPLPDYGMQVIIPSFASSTLGEIQPAENAGIGVAGNQTGAGITANVQTAVTSVNISQQLHDRGGYEGGSFDSILQAQLLQSVKAQISQAILATSIANAGMVMDNVTLTTTKLWADLSTAAENIADTAGVRFNGTHVFTTTDFFRWAAKQVDSQGRPIFTPDAAAIEAAVTNGRGNGYTGIVLPGNLRWHTDDSLAAIQATNTNPTQAQVLLVQAPEIYIYEAQPVAFSMIEPQAATLSVLVGIRVYFATAARFNAAVQVISGSGLASLK